MVTSLWFPLETTKQGVPVKRVTPVWVSHGHCVAGKEFNHMVPFLFLTSRS